MTLPHRMAIPAMLFLTISAGFALSSFRNRTLLAVFCLLEIWLYPSYGIPLKHTSLPSSLHTTILKEAPEGAVLNIPVNLYSNHQRKYLWFQSQHQKPIADHFRYSMFPQISEKSVFLAASRSISKAPLPSAKNPDPLELNALYTSGFRYIVIHTEFVQEQHQIEAATYIAWMNLHLGEGVILDDVVLYPLDATLLRELLPFGTSSFTMGLPTQ